MTDRIEASKRIRAMMKEFGIHDVQTNSVQFTSGPGLSELFDPEGAASELESFLDVREGDTGFQPSTIGGQYPTHYRTFSTRVDGILYHQTHSKNWSGVF